MAMNMTLISLFAIIKRTAVAGAAVKLYAKKMPVKKIPNIPSDNKKFTIGEIMNSWLKIRNAKITVTINVKNLGYFIFKVKTIL